jgi:PST family polysaccharide transporter
VAVGDPGVGTRTLRGIFWAYGSYVAGRLLVLGSIAVLARVLTPSEFGLVAFALATTAILDGVSDLGLSQSLIISKDEDVERRADTAWTVSVLIGAVLTLVTFALAPVAAAFFDTDELRTLLPLLGVNFVLRALGITHFAIAQRQVDFRTRTVAELSDVVVRGAVGIGLALGGAGAYSLVGGYLAGSLALTAALWLLVPWRPRGRIRRDDLRAMLGFGGGVTALGLLSMVITTADYVVVGHRLGQEQLGLYTLGYRLPELLVVNLAIVAGLVLFPAMAGIARAALADAFLTSLRYTLIVAAPIAAGLLILAEPLVLIAFGDQWRASIPVMQVLTLYALAGTVDIPAGIAYKSIGRVDVLLKLAIPRAILALAGILLVVDRGIVAVATSQAAVAGLFTAIGIVLAARLLGTGGRRIWLAAWPALVATGALAAALWLVTIAIEDRYATVAVSIAGGAAVYLGCLWLVAHEVLQALWRLAVASTPRRSP